MPAVRGTARRLFRDRGHVAACRGPVCDGYSTLLTGPVFENTRPRPALLGLWRRGRAKGEPIARLARELGVSRKPWHTLRPRIQAHLHATAPTAVRAGPAFEADALDQEAGEQKHPASGSRRPATSARP